MGGGVEGRARQGHASGNGSVMMDTSVESVFLSHIMVQHTGVNFGLKAMACRRAVQ